MEVAMAMSMEAALGVATIANLSVFRMENHVRSGVSRSLESEVVQTIFHGVRGELLPAAVSTFVRISLWGITIIRY